MNYWTENYSAYYHELYEWALVVDPDTPPPPRGFTVLCCTGCPTRAKCDKPYNLGPRPRIKPGKPLRQPCNMFKLYVRGATQFSEWQKQIDLRVGKMKVLAV